MNSRLYQLTLTLIPMVVIFASGCIGQDESQLIYEYSFQLENDELKIIFYENGYCDVKYLSNGKESIFYQKYERKIFGEDPGDPDFKRMMENNNFILPLSISNHFYAEYIKIESFDDTFIFIDSEKKNEPKGPQYFNLYVYYLNGLVGGIPSESTIISIPEHYRNIENCNHLLIEYVHYDARGNDNYNKNDEFVIITNIGKLPVNMDECYIEDDKHKRYTFGSIILAAGDSLKLCSGSGQDTDNVLYWDSEYAIWNNTGDTTTLYNRYGDIISQHIIW